MDWSLYNFVQSARQGMITESGKRVQDKNLCHENVGIGGWRYCSSKVCSNDILDAIHLTSVRVGFHSGESPSTVTDTTNCCLVCSLNEANYSLHIIPQQQGNKCMNAFKMVADAVMGAKQ